MEIITYDKTSITIRTRIIKPMVYRRSEYCFACSTSIHIDEKKVSKPTTICALALSSMLFCQWVFLYKSF